MGAVAAPTAGLHFSDKIFNDLKTKQVSIAHLTHHVGLTATDVKDEDIDPGARSANSSIFWNGVYSLTERVRFALELSYWKTEYKEPEAETDSASSFRTQFAVMYRF